MAAAHPLDRTPERQERLNTIDRRLGGRAALPRGHLVIDWAMQGAGNAVITRVDQPAPARAGPLQGRTLLVKDLIDTAGIRTTYGSRYVPRSA